MTLLHSWYDGAAPTVSGTVSVTAGDGVPLAPSLLVGSSASAANARWDVNETALSARFYVRTPPAFASAACTIAAFRPTGSSIALGVTFSGAGDPGRLRLITTGGSTVAASPANSLQTSTEYRIEVTYTAATATGTLALYPMGSDTPVWSDSYIDATNWMQTITRVDLGRINVSPDLGDWLLDSIEIHDTTTTIGRAPGDDIPAPPAGAWHVWNGSTLVPIATTHIWDGSVLQPVSSTLVTPT